MIDLERNRNNWPSPGLRQISLLLAMNDILRANDAFTERQRTIAWALVRRTPIKRIAADLGISPSTVNDHIKSMKRKVGVESTSDLVAAILENHALPNRSNEGGIKNRVPSASDLELDDGRGEQPDPLSPLSQTPVGTVPDDEPSIVPEEFDGPNGSLSRLVAITKIVALIFAAAVLAIVAMESMVGFIDSRGLSAP